MSQQKEGEKAIYEMGEYKFKDNYRHLEVESVQWFKMTPQQRKGVIGKVLKETCIPYESELELPSTSASYLIPPTSGAHLSIPPDKSGIISLPADYVLSLWNKAEALLNTPNVVCNAPGIEGAKCIDSESGGRPHIVARGTKGLLQCNQDCLGWKAQQIYSHVLAAAKSMGCLGEFLRSYKGNKTVPNLTAAIF